MAASSDTTRALQTVRGIQASLATRVQEASSIPSQLTARSAVSEIHSPRVFISWAHAHRNWGADDISEWESQVAEFALTLRTLGGIDADVDLFHLDESVDWTRFGPRGIQDAQWTIIVMSRAWEERWSGTNSPQEGAGAAAEADTLRGLFARDQSEWQKRIVTVMFPDIESSIVPPDLARATRVSVDPSDPDSYENLIRVLTGQARYPKPPLGAVPTLMATDTYASALLRELRQRLTANEVRQKQLERADQDATSDTRKAELSLNEAALRGFIDAALKQDE